MRAAGARSAARAASLIASTCLFVLCDSGSPVFAACAIDTPTQLFAGPGQTCSVLGKSYDGGAINIAVQASGAGAVISWTSGGLSTILTSGDGLSAVQSDSGGFIDLSGGAIQTSGAAAPAVLSLANGGGGATVMLSGGTTILTSSDGSAGLAVNGSGAALTATGPGPLAGVLVKTTGVGSIGASNGFGSGASPGGVMNLMNTTIDTLGEGAHALAVSGAGSITNLGVGNALTTQGNGAYGLFATSGGVILAPDAPSITTFGSGAIGLYASGAGSSVAVGGGATVVTGGAVAPAAQADNGGLVTLNGASLATSGNSSHALLVSGAGSQAALSGANVFTTSGAGAIGLYALNGGVINALGPVTVSTTGGVLSATGLGANGVSADGAGSQVNLNAGGNVTAAGAFVAALAATNGGTITAPDGLSVSVAGSNSLAVSASGAGATGVASTITLTGATIVDNGATPVGAVVADVGGVVVLNGGSVTLGPTTSDAAGLFAAVSSTISAAGTSIATEANDAVGVVSTSGSAIVLTGGEVTTKGDGSPGLVSQFGSSLSATGMTIETEGGVDRIAGQSSAGVWIYGAGATAALAGDTIMTSGAESDGILAEDGGQATLSGVNGVATNGNGSIGLHALSGGVINASGQTTIVTAGSILATTGLAAYGVDADGAGSQINLAAASITTTGAGAAGLYASDATGAGRGGAITVSGPLGIVTGGLSAYGAWAQGAGSTITLAGPTTMAISGNESAGLMAAAGGLIAIGGPTSIAVSGAGSTGVHAVSGAITASGALNVTTSLPSSAAFALQGISPSIIASGGGTISAAGAAIAFTNAANAVATFDNFNIKTSGGDLIVADPSTATINFNRTIANAGAGNLLNATAGSTVAFNASASTLTGAIQTDAASTTNVALTNGTNWTMSAPSTATSLNLANSAIVFSPSGAFKTLTVGSYFGTGANITLNTALGGPNAGSTDQLIINGGSAAGLTSLTIKNASGAAGSATTGAGIPVVVATNGGTTSPGAFYLANGAPILAGGNEYTLGRDSNQDWYLTSSPAATVGQIQNSVTESRQGAAQSTDHHPGARLIASRRQRAGERLRLRRRLCFDRLLFAGLPRAMELERQRDSARRRRFRAILSGRRQCEGRPDRRRLASLRSAELGQEPSVPRVWRRGLALYRRDLHPLLHERAHSGAGGRFGGRSIDLGLRTRRLGRPADPDR